MYQHSFFAQSVKKLKEWSKRYLKCFIEIDKTGGFTLHYNYNKTEEELFHNAKWESSDTDLLAMIAEKMDQHGHCPVLGQYSNEWIITHLHDGFEMRGGDDWLDNKAWCAIKDCSLCWQVLGSGIMSLFKWATLFADPVNHFMDDDKLDMISRMIALVNSEQFMMLRPGKISIQEQVQDRLNSAV